MNINDLIIARQFNPMAECGYRLINLKHYSEAFVPHDHDDFYEFYFILNGKAEHEANGMTRNVSRGDLIFVRKQDLHNFYNVDENLQYLLLNFSEKTLQSLFEFLGAAVPAETLLEAQFPPTVRLTDKETDTLHMKFAELNLVDPADWAKLKFKVRVLLVELFSKYFYEPYADRENAHIPLWLENAYEKMKKPKNFIQGIDRFFELCGVTREHATRSLQRWYGVTPSDYICDLRLTYAAGLLVSSDFDVMDTCFESGFRNVSWFYKAFTEKFGVTPAKYRANAKKLS